MFKGFGKKPAVTEEVIQDRAIEIIAKTIEKHGLRLEEHMRMIEDDRIYLTVGAQKALVAGGLPENVLKESLQDVNAPLTSIEGVELGFDRTNFQHPLTKVAEDDPEFINTWGAVSLWLCIAQNWFNIDGDLATPEGQRNCRSVLRDCFRKSAPTANFESAMFRSRYDDRALMWLCNKCVEGFDISAAQAFEKQK